MRRLIDPTVSVYMSPAGEHDASSGGEGGGEAVEPNDDGGGDGGDGSEDESEQGDDYKTLLGGGSDEEESSSSEEEGDDDGSESDGKGDESDEEQSHVPESYDLTHEGVDLNAERLGKFGEFAKEMGWTNEDAQKVLDQGIDLIMKPLIEEQESQWKNVTEGWRSAAESDPEYGGSGFGDNVQKVNQLVDFVMLNGMEGDARKAAEKELASFKNDLNVTGLGNHPTFVRILHRLAPLVRQGAFHGGGVGSSAGGKSGAQSIYGSMENP